MGTRDAIRAAATTSKDHPHAYGDKSYPQKIFFLPKLSSPRVWGQEIYDKLTEMRARIIPTRMGTRTGQYTDLPGYKDHPHAYGDKSSRTNTAQKILGSSPRVWGQGLTKHICKKRLRIIPTRMGTSDYIINKILIIWDHPHAYGDKPDTLEKTGNIEKSSPRVWGQAIIAGTMLVLSRIIPTRMGTR